MKSKLKKSSTLVVFVLLATFSFGSTVAKAGGTQKPFLKVEVTQKDAVILYEFEKMSEEMKKKLEEKLETTTGVTGADFYVDGQLLVYRNPTYCHDEVHENVVTVLRMHFDIQVVYKTPLIVLVDVEDRNPTITYYVRRELERTLEDSILTIAGVEYVHVRTNGEIRLMRKPSSSPEKITRDVIALLLAHFGTREIWVFNTKDTTPSELDKKITKMKSVGVL